MRIDEIYAEIGQTIMDSIPEEWQSSQLEINRLDKYISVDGTYRDVNSIEKKMDDSNFGYFFSLKIHELHSLMSGQGKNPWNKLKFVLYPNGKFEINFIWDQEYQDEIDNLNEK